MLPVFMLSIPFQIVFLSTLETVVSNFGELQNLCPKLSVTGCSYKNIQAHWLQTPRLAQQELKNLGYRTRGL